jgi:signal transduction histidine kinase
MTVGSSMESGSPADAVGEPSECFAVIVEESRTAILMSYQEALEAPDGPATGNARCRDQLLALGSQIITDIVAGVRAGSPYHHDDRFTTSSAEVTPKHALPPAQSLRAAAMFFEITTNSLGRHVRGNQRFLPHFIMAILALNESLNMRVRHAADTYTEYLLHNIHQAHHDERRRIARELHDRLGEGLSVALRQLEQMQILAAGQSPAQDRRITQAEEALTEAMLRLRVVTSDLRQEPVTSLQRALVRYLDSVETEAEVRIQVSGDEKLGPPAVIDEVYLIIREALRNALSHASPRQVRVVVTLTPHELHAYVRDDGRGFTPNATTPAGGAAGLATMRERAALVGGTLNVSSSPGRGTTIRICVPLPICREA